MRRPAGFQLPSLEAVKRAPEKEANATAAKQWPVHWLRGADLNRRPLGYAI
jgi:hypothetical protein